ncbi:tetrathionate reductase subunit B [Desulfuromusa kysingii]|uniref:Tetrathionate reductase subunit B n=1 Tax=Desulfuromusa kysingii TaxID=37625 RepID=A0A1H4DKC9_9BACT|nr:4Fe-4S dicluster domain-containing protein [Desulfuromusa kysingii]SEA73006.1 tetrathionate reductase subunit B [Desulfuromusa kysingii]
MIKRRTLLKAMGATVPLTLIPTALIFAKTKTDAKHYAMVIDVRRCTGCMSCSIACAIENGTPKGMNRNQVRQFTVAQEESFGTMAIPTQCGQCEEPPCVDVCPADATAKNKDGIVYLDRDACIACQACVEACPYGARAGDENEEIAPEKCDFCISRLSYGLLPACVESCVGHARIFGDLNSPDSKLVQTIKANDVYAMLPEAGTQPSIFYIGLPGDTEDQKVLNLNHLNWQR